MRRGWGQGGGMVEETMSLQEKDGNEREQQNLDSERKGNQFKNAAGSGV